MLDATAVVLGDIMLDRHIYAVPTGRVNPEADVPIWRVERTVETLGGAAAVAMLVQSLGGTARLIGTLGDDHAGQRVRTLARKAGVWLAGVPQRATTIKQRVLVDGKQAAPRLDIEDASLLKALAQDSIINEVLEAVKGAGVLIVADYAKGVCGERVLRAAINAATREGVPVLVDPGRGVPWEWYRGATIKANEAERFESGPWRGPQPWIVTLGDRGMVMIVDGEIRHFPAEPVEARCVTGAGDTVAAVIGLCMAKGIDLAEACRWANKLAGVQVTKGPGVQPVSLSEVAMRYWQAGEPVEEAEWWTLVDFFQRRFAPVIFANGCFDGGCHKGHRSTLRFAAERGRTLIVAVNSDASVRGLGKGEPLFPQAERAALVSALRWVTLAVVFDEPTPATLLARIKPRWLVKGFDYAGREVAGAEHAGGVMLAPLVPGVSTSGIKAGLAGRERDVS